MKLYIIAEAQYLMGCCNELESENISAFANVATNYDDARNKLREMVRELVNAEHEDDPDEPDIDGIIDEIIDGGVDDEWTWNATNRAVRWRILEREV